MTSMNDGHEWEYIPGSDARGDCEYICLGCDALASDAKGSEVDGITCAMDSDSLDAMREDIASRA